MALGKTIREIEQLDTPELRGWIAFGLIEPFGEPVKDARQARSDCLLASIHSTNGSRPKVEDFMPDYAKPAKKAQTVSQMRHTLNFWAKSHNQNGKR